MRLGDPLSNRFVERSIGLWSASVQPFEHDSEGMHSLMGADGFIAVSKPHVPDPLMMTGTGFQVHPPGKKDRWMPTVATLLNQM